LYVVLVCDGPIPHHSKRASTERVSQLYNNTINSYIAQTELMQLMQQHCCSNDATEIATIMIEEANLSKRIRTLAASDQSAKIDVGQDFYLTLINYIDGLPKSDFGESNGKISVIKAKFQADSILSYRLLNNISNLCLTIDSDIAALAGLKCVCI
jgi:hypothetical protein